MSAGHGQRRHVVHGRGCIPLTYTAPHWNQSNRCSMQASFLFRLCTARLNGRVGGLSRRHDLSPGARHTVVIQTSSKPASYSFSFVIPSRIGRFSSALWRVPWFGAHNLPSLSRVTFHAGDRTRSEQRFCRCRTTVSVACRCKGG